MEESSGLKSGSLHFSPVFSHSAMIAANCFELFAVMKDAADAFERACGLSATSKGIDAFSPFSWEMWRDLRSDCILRHRLFSVLS